MSCRPVIDDCNFGGHIEGDVAVEIVNFAKRFNPLTFMLFPTMAAARRKPGELFLRGAPGPSDFANALAELKE